MPRRMGERMLVRSLLVAVVAVLLVASTAAAGTYSHYARVYPNGRTGAPLSNGTDGWRPAGNVSNFPGYTSYERCSTDGAFGTKLTRETTSQAGNDYGWRYYAPLGTSVKGFSVALVNYANPDMGEVDVAQDGDRYFYRNIRGGQAGSGGAPIVVEASGLTPAGGPFIWGSCDATECSAAPGQPIAGFDIYRARVDLDDSSAPTGRVAGESASEDTWASNERLEVSAHDAGGGVYRFLLRTDGAVVQTVAASTQSSCVDIAPGNSNPYEFASPKPCPDDAGAVIDIDTHELSEGPHTFEVIAEDAGGNRRTIYGPIVKTVRNAATASQNSAPILSPVLRLTARSVRTGRARVAVRFGERARFVGVLRD